MTKTFYLVECADGSLVRKRFDELMDDDRIAFDGPDAFREVDDAVADLDRRIKAAGGLEAWQALPAGN